MKIDIFPHILPAKYKEALYKGIKSPFIRNFQNALPTLFDLDHRFRIMDKFDDYDIFVHEFHHNRKADSPSGTAVMIGKILTDSIKRKENIVSEELQRKILPEELHISSTRSGSIPGTHIVGFDGKADTIELKHTARGREGFALGAIKAAEWINGKKGFFDIDAMMKNIVGGN